MPLNAGEHQVEVAKDDHGARLDRLLAAALPDVSRSRIKPLIKDGMVRLGEMPVTDPARRVQEGEVYLVELPPEESVALQPEKIPLEILYEDAHLIVINKPAGMVVHPAAGNQSGTLVNALLYHCEGRLSRIDETRPGIVHRLDKETSGVLVAAKTDRAHRGLAAQFAAHTTERRYKAVVWGRLYPASGEISGNIGRDPRNRKRMAILDEGGKVARTRYRLLENFSDIAALVECRLETGRTHQIRVHMTHIGHPLVGDPQYSRSRKSRIRTLSAAQQKVILDFQRQALHAETLGFVHPVTDKPLKFEVDLPCDLRELIAAFRGGAPTMNLP